MNNLDALIREIRTLSDECLIDEQEVIVYQNKISDMQSNIKERREKLGYLKTILVKSAETGEDPLILKLKMDPRTPDVNAMSMEAYLKAIDQSYGSGMPSYDSAYNTQHQNIRVLKNNQ